MKKILSIIGLISTFIAGYYLMLLIIKKYSNKIYRNDFNEDEIDFDDLGPEIVRKENQ